MKLRSLVLNEQTWKYFIGKSNVRFESPSGEKFSASFAEVTGLRWDDIERGIWKKTFAIRPSDIRRYLEAR